MRGRELREAELGAQPVEERCVASVGGGKEKVRVRLKRGVRVRVSHIYIMYSLSGLV
jgi:hypothetical protein